MENMNTFVHLIHSTNILTQIVHIISRSWSFLDVLWWLLCQSSLPEYQWIYSSVVQCMIGVWWRCGGTGADWVVTSVAIWQSSGEHVGCWLELHKLSKITTSEIFVINRKQGIYFRLNCHRKWRWQAQVRHNSTILPSLVSWDTEVNHWSHRELDTDILP